MQSDRPAAVQDDEDAEEDALPDWTRFAALAKSNKNNVDDSGPAAVPFIPKRGEKDFEPLPLNSKFDPSSNEALLSQHQQNTLTISRNALYSALSSGTRHHSSKAHNSFTWRPELDGGRATSDAAQTFGIHFTTLGTFSIERQRLELLPEEALYLIERGAIEMWREAGEASRVPMSVQQAWSELIGCEELTLDRYQIYAYLKRLGYIVVRARTPPQGVRTDTSRTSALTTTASPLYRALISPLVLTNQLVATLKRSCFSLWRLLLPPTARLGVTRALAAGEGAISSLLSGKRWATYDHIFSRLQIIPSGYDTPLPRGPLPQAASVLSPTSPCQDTVAGLPDLRSYPYQAFWHVYKPSSKYKKTNPPAPDFRLVVVNAATTPLPNLFEFVSMFDSTPFSNEDTLLPPPRPNPSSTPTPASISKAKAAASNPQSSRPVRPFRPPPPPPSFLKRFLSYLPFGPTLPPKRKLSPYPRLKVGRRTVLVAVVDNGTTSFLRFSESEFAKLGWQGPGRAA